MEPDDHRLGKAIPLFSAAFQNVEMYREEMKLNVSSIIVDWKDEEEDRRGRYLFEPMEVYTCVENVTAITVVVKLHSEDAIVRELDGWEACRRRIFAE